MRHRDSPRLLLIIHDGYFGILCSRNTLVIFAFPYCFKFAYSLPSSFFPSASFIAHYCWDLPRTTLKKSVVSTRPRVVSTNSRSPKIILSPTIAKRASNHSSNSIGSISSTLTIVCWTCISLTWGLGKCAVDLKSKFLGWWKHNSVWCLIKDW